jgi:hypothetical protein
MHAVRRTLHGRDLGDSGRRVNAWSETHGIACECCPLDTVFSEDLISQNVALPAGNIQTCANLQWYL